MLAMNRTQTAAAGLAERMCRPQRIGVFGHRGVGKTTLLTMLYREAVGGRLPGLRLAAADARTANYLSDKIQQIEAGQPLPGTLAETDLRFHLYHQNARLELLFKDYQGEHVELGREEPIRDFLRDCDAVWLCLDAALVSDSGQRLRRQQEVEQIVEDYLATEPLRGLHRPMALVLTKADLLEPGDADRWTEHFGMTLHTLQSHCPRNAMLAVSCLSEKSLGSDTLLSPFGLAELLTWLSSALQAQDEARLEWLWSRAGAQLGVLERCVGCFARRYPEAPATPAQRQQLRQLRRRRYWRRGLAGIAAAVSLIVGLWTYDALGQRAAARFEEEHAEAPAAAIERWESYQARHPTRHLTWTSSAEGEESHLRDLRQQVRRQQCDLRLAELRRRAADADADPDAAWLEFQSFHADYPEVSVDGDLEQLRAAVKARHDREVARRAQRAYDELLTAEQRTKDLEALIDQADRFLARFGSTLPEADVRRRREAYFSRMDEHGIEIARDYSARNPLNFQTRRQHYQRYLDKHPTGAAVKEAQAALKTIEAEWDKHDFRSVRDHFLNHPGNIPELVVRCRTYLAVHPSGRFTTSANELLRWSERVTAPGEYKVVLRDGCFEKKIARMLSRGPDLSVELEVNGVRHGPSNFFKNRYDPDWDYEFPRRVRWKLGDPITIRVIDNDWRKRTVIEVHSEDGDPLAIRMLTGDVWSGPNRITFACDFAMPKLPKIE
jgi:hypothetical protein